MSPEGMPPVPPSPSPAAATVDEKATSSKLAISVGWCECVTKYERADGGHNQRVRRAKIAVHRRPLCYQQVRDDGKFPRQCTIDGRPAPPPLFWCDVYWVTALTQPTWWTAIPRSWSAALRKSSVVSSYRIRRVAIVTSFARVRVRSSCVSADRETIETSPVISYFPS